MGGRVHIVFERAQGSCLKNEAKSNELMPRELKPLMIFCGARASSKYYVQKCTTATGADFFSRRGPTHLCMMSREPPKALLSIGRASQYWQVDTSSER